MKWGSETYRAGAFERLEDARLLHNASRPALSMYSAGLAVEGMLRSLNWLKTKQLDERHDLRNLAVRVESLGLLRRGEPDSDFVEKIQAIARHWSNVLRFAANDQLSRWLRAIGAIRREDEGEIRRLCQDHYNRCSEVVRRCEVLYRRATGKDGRR